MKKVGIITKKVWWWFVSILCCLDLGGLVITEKDVSTGILMRISWTGETSKNSQNFREVFPLLLVILQMRDLA